VREGTTMYKEGDVKLTTKPCKEYIEEGYCDHYLNEAHAVYDSRNGGDKIANVAYLPHSCDEWVIGGMDEIDKLIHDLETAKATMLGGVYADI
jgi:hypothetical protein